MEEARRGAIPPSPLLFYGSSSFRLWSSLGEDFSGRPVVNRGFGGSTLAECVTEFDRLVTPLRPHALVCYAGDNDLDHGASPEEVAARFDKFMAMARARIGWTPIYFLSIKASPVRFWNIDRIRRANELLPKRIEERWSEVRWIDVFHPMLTEHGQPRRELFCDDGLHLSREGYRLWTGMIAGALSEHTPEA
jgi:lysophospholipase L1-like esterase